jgi:predicted  nucleic acid-binding Zn-ribbon protein
MTINDSVIALKAQLAEAKAEGDSLRDEYRCWKQLYKDIEAELEAKTERLLVCESDCDRYQKLYTETLDLLKQEQADHIKTRDSLLKIIGDTITNKDTNQGNYRK